MGDVWDYKLRKMELVWDLAGRVIPASAEDTGGFTREDFLKSVQETLKEAHAVIDAVFVQDKGLSGP